MAAVVMEQRTVEEVAMLKSSWQRRNLSTSSCLPINFKIPGVNIHWNRHFVIFVYRYDKYIDGLKERLSGQIKARKIVAYHVDVIYPR